MPFLNRFPSCARLLTNVVETINFLGTVLEWGSGYLLYFAISPGIKS